MQTDIFCGDSWYLDKNLPEQVFEGEIVKETKEPGVSINRIYLYFLKVKDALYPIYTGAKEEKIFETLVGTHVRLRGKLILSTLNKQVKEIWPARVDVSERLGV